jgi:hypothetical protein
LKIISPERTYIDYFQSLRAVQRGLINRFGIRVREGDCVAVIHIGAGQANTFGTVFPLPLQLQNLPKYLQMIIDDHLLNYADSDLIDVLSCKKSFQEALDFPKTIEIQPAPNNRLERLPNAS